VKVRKIDRPTEDYSQCQFPKEKLNLVGWKGYREGQSRRNGRDPSTCMRPAQWEVDGQKLCTQHAGAVALEHLEKQQ